jgi:hypothetical protein
LVQPLASKRWILISASQFMPNPNVEYACSL